MIAWSYSDTKLCGLLPELAQDANKYTRGKVSLVAGCSRYPGAAALAALASQRMGAGYTEVICAPKSRGQPLPRRPLVEEPLSQRFPADAGGPSIGICPRPWL